MCTHNKDNEWYIYLRNKDTKSQSLPQPGGMTQECALIIRIINGTSTYVTRTPCHKACPNLVEWPTMHSKEWHVYAQRTYMNQFYWPWIQNKKYKKNKDQNNIFLSNVLLFWWNPFFQIFITFFGYADFYLFSFTGSLKMDICYFAFLLSKIS